MIAAFADVVLTATTDRPTFSIVMHIRADHLDPAAAA